jgi:hypothetical protein
VQLLRFFGVVAALSVANLSPAQARLWGEPNMVQTPTIDEQFEIAQATPEPAPAPVAPLPDIGADEPTSPTPETPSSDEDILPDLSSPSNEDDFSVGEIPVVETVELTAEGSRKALDAYVLVREKYKDAELENYESLQDFVEQNAQGRAFEADIKSFGFADVNVWNVTISTVGFAYANEVDDQTEDIRQQIEEVKADTEMAQDMRDRMVAALNAMIPSANNKTVVEGLMADTVYLDKLKQLETEEE